MSDGRVNEIVYKSSMTEGSSGFTTSMDDKWKSSVVSACGEFKVVGDVPMVVFDRATASGGFGANDSGSSVVVPGIVYGPSYTVEISVTYITCRDHGPAQDVVKMFEPIYYRKVSLRIMTIMMRKKLSLLISRR